VGGWLLLLGVLWTDGGIFEIVIPTGLKDRLNPFNIGITVFLSYAVQLGLKFRGVCLLLVKCDITGARILLKILHVKLNMLSGVNRIYPLQLYLYIKNSKSSN
jgi:hypothetical protein